MKICFYALREFDELIFCRQMKQKYNIDFVYSTEYPTPENISLASGCDGVSCTPCDMSEKVLKAFNDVGVKYMALPKVFVLHTNQRELFILHHERIRFILED